jgi:hypothetical protein
VAEPDSVLASPAADEGPRWLPALLALVSLLPNPGAALPFLTYYFRDFSLTYYPILDFVGDEVRSGRWPFWNPYLYEGSPVLPAFYPIELLHVLWPGPAMVSWLLTLHFPLAALAMYALARDLGACRYGAFAAGAVYSMCGLSLSALNVQMFLQTLAWAPLLVLSLRRAALGRPWATVAAAVCLALSISTLAVEFVGQALGLGLTLALVRRADRGALARLAAALVVGVALAGLPIALTLGIVAESVRSQSMTAFEIVQKAVHPVMALQLVVPDLPGSVAEPLRFWWGARFFPHGSPYFMSLFVGPLALCVAVAGIGALPRRERLVLAAAALLSAWYALGAWGGLAPLLAPAVRVFRFPAKAMLTPMFVLALCAGMGMTRLRAGNAWSRLAAPALFFALVGLGLWYAVGFHSSDLAAWLDASPDAELAMRAIVGPEALSVVALAGVVGGVLVAVARRAVPPERAALVVLALLVLDVWRGGTGLNRQVAPRYFEPLPELARHEAGLDGGRFFSFGTDWGPTGAAFSRSRRPGVEMLGFFIARQVLNPFLNVLDRVEVAEGTDRHSLIPNPSLLKPWDSRPSELERILPVLRNAAVVRLASLDPIEHPAVRLRERFPAGPEGVFVHIYDLLGSSPRSYVACRVVHASGRQAAREAAFAPGFDPAADVALEVPGEASCRGGQVVRRVVSSDEVSYDVDLDGPGYLVARDGFSRGFVASLDGAPAEVLRANGRHQAVAVPPGRHAVVVRYAPPGFAAGAVVSLLGLIGLAILAQRRPPGSERS